MAGDSRSWCRLEAHLRGYVLMVISGQRLGMVPIEEWPGEVPPDGWQRS